MATNVQLIIHNVVGAFSVLVIMVLGFFVLLKDYRKSVNITLGLTFLSVIVAILSNIIGVSVSDPDVARSVLMWNVSVVFISVFNFHCVMALLDREKEKRGLIYFVYTLGVLFALTFIIFPDTFIGEPAPKLYFANYYTPGHLHLLFNIIFKIVIPGYFIHELYSAYKSTIDKIERNRYLYFMLAFTLGWLLGIVPTFLVWNINIDPLWGLLFPIVFAVPFTYAIFRYELLNIRVVAKNAFLYAASIIGIGVLMAFFNLSDEWLKSAYPGFPIWVIPLVSSVLLVTIGLIIWKQLKDSEILKYEFITTVTHKFRTPLTHIKWATENLRAAKTPEDEADQLSYIESANSKLTELTDLLANASQTDDSVYKYRLEKDNLSKFVEEMIKASEEHAVAKKLHLVREIDGDVFATFDASRLRFVLQTFIENAINYTPLGGTVTITVKKVGEEAICSVKDTGIGIPKNELSMISTKLYRGARARSTDTEGMGIGLFVSKGVLVRHHGRITIESDGENKGATFSFSLPSAKN